MKKTAAFLSLFVLLFSANLAFADQGNGEIRGHGNIMTRIKLGGKENIITKRHNESQFIVMGHVKSVTGSEFVISAEDFHKRFGDLKGDVTIKTDSGTKISMLGDATTLASIKVGSRVIVKGEKNGADFVADWVQVKAEKRKVAGEVTAKTDSSITIKNNLTGESSTAQVDDDTKITINGEVKTLADVQVGDKGRVKFRVMLDTVIAKFVTLFR